MIERDLYLRKSRWGWVLLTLQKLLINTLKTQSNATRNIAEYFALNPTATMIHARSPKVLTAIRLALQLSPLKMKPRKRKIRRTLPASWKYVLFVEEGSESSGSPAKAILRRWRESDRTINNPPMTLKFLSSQWRRIWMMGGAPEEEVDIKDQAISKGLRNNHSQKGDDTDFWMFSRNNHITSA